MSITLQRTALAITFGALSPAVFGAGAALAAPPAAVAPAPGEPAQGWPEQPGEPQPSPGVVFVEVRPSPVQPGYLVGIRASCRDNSIPATVVSDAFGRVQVHSQRGELTASAEVRERTRPGNYRVKLECRDGATASTMLQVVKSMKPSPGPHTGFGGGAAGANLAGLLVPGGLALTIAGATVGIIAARRPRGAARG
ncbi:hypothetical protein GA0074696_4485 [Micromonospora purpureochromogenes]|uniref:Uncharacterized protein n=1 Tax=Micromonospora purpureochromogenes TaxID=47872 RepID=A0A1C4ZIS0_9ACTN|nr:hypothetical protein [Micromonospora purpureochromogenes]SCF32862.1 hypothetical protein GA0074696_4485 [Micromonospora purpureochromogenes]